MNLSVFFIDFCLPIDLLLFVTYFRMLPTKAKKRIKASPLWCRTCLRTPRDVLICLSL